MYVRSRLWCGSYSPFEDENFSGFFFFFSLKSFVSDSLDNYRSNLSILRVTSRYFSLFNESHLNQKQYSFSLGYITKSVLKFLRIHIEEIKNN